MGKFLAPAIAAVLIAGYFLAMLIYSEKKHKRSYDERQVLARGKAYKAATFTAITYLVICAFLGAWEVHWAETGVQMMLGLFLVIFVFAFVSVIKDAYLRINASSVLYIIITFFGAAIYAVRGVQEISENEKLVENGMLSGTALFFIYAFMFFAIAVTMLVKKIMNKRGEEA